MTYGSPVWEEAISRTGNLAKLQRVQRLVNIKMTKAYRTVSFEASCVLAGVPPIGIVIEERARPLVVYTDGSKDTRSVGAGVAIYQHKQLIKQGKYRLSNYVPTTRRSS
jgi:hypothetical protein